MPYPLCIFFHVTFFSVFRYNDIKSIFDACCNIVIIFFNCIYGVSIQENSLFELFAHTVFVKMFSQCFFTIFSGQIQPENDIEFPETIHQIKV